MMSEILQDFDTCPEKNEKKRNKLVIYRKMLDILNDERKTSEELLNYEICNSKNCLMHMAEDVGEECIRTEESGSEDSFVSCKLPEMRRKHMDELEKELVETLNKLENVDKRKLKEAFAVNKKLKSANATKENAMQESSKEKIKTWITKKVKDSFIIANKDYYFKKLKQDEASFKHTLEQLKKSSDPDEEELALISNKIDLCETDIAELQQKVLEWNQGKRTKWSMIRNVSDAKAALETAFDIFMQDRKQQCYEYNELKEKYLRLQVQIRENKRN